MRYVVKGGSPLQGELVVKGAKNAVLPALSATILSPGVYEFEDVPKVRDVFCMLNILSHLGATWKFAQDKLIVDTTHLNRIDIPYELASQIRASILFLGPLVARFGEAIVPLPGGCQIGKRPVNFHQSGILKLSAEISLDHGNLVAKAKKLRGAEIVLDFPSVTTTENLMMAAALAEGETVLRNVAREPEVVFLARLLKKMGAEVKGEGTDTIIIKGKKRLNPAKSRIILDRIEAGTFLILASLNPDNQVIIKNFPFSYLEAPLLKFQEMGGKIKAKGKDVAIVYPPKSFTPVEIATLPYPGFPTDLQPIFAVALTQADGVSVIKENLFENRFLYALELNRLGANIKIEDRTIFIQGVTPLSGSQVKATDLRAGAALLLAGLIAENTTIIHRAELIERGYEDLPGRLQSLGACIEVSPCDHCET